MTVNKEISNSNVLQIWFKMCFDRIQNVICSKFIVMLLFLGKSIFDILLFKFDNRNSWFVFESIAPGLHLNIY